MLFHRKGFDGSAPPRSAIVLVSLSSVTKGTQERSHVHVTLRIEPVRPRRERPLPSVLAPLARGSVAKHGGRVVALGRLDEALESGPTIEAHTVMILVEWPSREAFQAFLDDPDLEDLRPLFQA